MREVMYVLDYTINKNLNQFSNALLEMVLSNTDIKLTKTITSSIERAVKCFVHNMHTCVLRKKTYFNITLDRVNYSNAQVVNGRKSNKKISYKYTKLIVDYLVDEGLIFLEKGGEVVDWWWDDNNSWSPTFSKSYVHINEPLFEMYFLSLEGKVPCFHYNANVIYVKDRNGKFVTFNMDSFRKEVKTYLQEFNKFSLGVNVTAKDGGRLDVQQYQVYNVDFNHGGRSYMKGDVSYQSLSKEERNKVLIDDVKTVSYDYKGFEPSLLYSLEQEVMSFDDPYDINIDKIEEYDQSFFRGLCKRALLIMLNSESRNKAKLAMNRFIHKKYDIDDLYDNEKIPFKVIPVDDIIKALLVKHHMVAHKFFCKHGAVLQNSGAKVIDYVVNYFLQRGELCLQVHDSCRVKHYLEDDLKRVMKEGWEHVIGFDDNCNVVKE